MIWFATRFLSQSQKVGIMEWTVLSILYKGMDICFVFVQDEYLIIFLVVLVVFKTSK